MLFHPAIVVDQDYRDPPTRKRSLGTSYPSQATSREPVPAIQIYQCEGASHRPILIGAPTSIGHWYRALLVSGVSYTASSFEQ